MTFTEAIQKPPKMTIEVAFIKSHQRHQLFPIWIWILARIHSVTSLIASSTIIRFLILTLKFNHFSHNWAYDRQEVFKICAFIDYFWFRRPPVYVKKPSQLLINCPPMWTKHSRYFLDVLANNNINHPTESHDSSK